MWLLSRQVIRGMREYVRSVDVLFLEPFQLETALHKGSSVVSAQSEGKSETKSYLRGNIVSLHPSVMRHQLYPNRVAVYATEENIKMFRFIYPQEPLTILHKELEPDYPEDLLNQYQYAPSPFDKSKARELGISNQELASLTEELEREREGQGK